MLINDPNNRRWLIFVTVVTLLAILWFIVESRQVPERLPGRNPARFWLGVAGGSICMFEMLIWPRKAFRRWGQTFRLGKTQDWMRAHLWLGVLSLPLLVLHAGIFPWGGSLATVLMLLFLSVIVSGFWGLAMQQIIPKKMLQEVPGETIYSQIDFVSAQLRNEAHQVVQITCEGSATGTDAATEPKKAVVSGKPKDAGLITGFVAIEKTDVIREQFERQIARYICPDPIFQYYQKNPRDRPPHPPKVRKEKSPLRDPREAGIFFQSLKREVDLLAHPAVEKIAELCHRRRQFERQRQLHHRLHNWLAIHLPLSIALIILMWVHIIVSIRYIR